MSMATPVVMVGETIRLNWPNEDGSFHWFDASVAAIEKLKKVKKGSQYKYTLLFEDGDTITSTLVNREWNRAEEADSKEAKKKMIKEKKKEKKNKREPNDSATATTNDNGSSLFLERPLKHPRIQCQYNTKYPLPPYRYICAPMVGASELAFRLLCRRYGTELAYTPMMNSELFAVDEEYRKEQFQCTQEDRPIVAHFSGNNAEIMVQAAKHVENRCDAIDLNLGCPQRVAYAGKFGSFLLAEEHRGTVLSIVRALSQNIKIPIFVKIRLLDTVPETIRLCQQLVVAGASLIAIHARYRVDLTLRTGPSARDGPAYLDQVEEVKKVISSIPIIANGNVITWEDVERNLVDTGADGIMSAEGLLDNPALFYQSLSAGKDIHVDKLDLAREYLDLVEEYPVTMKCLIFHIRRMCKTELSNYQLLNDCLASKTPNEVRDVICKAVQYRDNPRSYKYDPEKEVRAKQAAAKKKFEEGKRKRFEERMIRKAKREGLEDLHFYLNQGSDPPSLEEIEAMKKLSEEDRFAVWKDKFSQHCYRYHFETCIRDRACAFLHADASLGESLSFG